MAKVLATEVRAGNLIERDKRVWRVLKSHHVHVGGRGGAYMQVEMKDIEAGTKNNVRFRTDEKIERAYVDQRDMQYLYHDGDNFVFMDKESYEQLSLSAEFLEGQAAVSAAQHRHPGQLLRGAPHRRAAARKRDPHRGGHGAQREGRHRDYHLQARKDGNDR